MQESENAPKPVKQLDHRYEGIAKVTGKVRYAAEFSGPFTKRDLVYAYIVQSTIPSGTIVSIDRAAADRSPGVIAILTPLQRAKVESGAAPTTCSTEPEPATGCDCFLQRPACRDRGGEVARPGKGSCCPG